MAGGEALGCGYSVRRADPGDRQWFDYDFADGHRLCVDHYVSRPGFVLGSYSKNPRRPHADLDEDALTDPDFLVLARDLDTDPLRAAAVLDWLLENASPALREWLEARLGGRA